MKRGALLTVNTGSSSIKLSAYEVAGGQLGNRLLRANLSGLADQRQLSGQTTEGEIDSTPDRLIKAGTGPGELVAAFAEWAAEKLAGTEIRAVGHRIVHGGQAFTGPVRCSADVVERLRALVELAPAHQPANLAGIEGISWVWPDILQSLSFDTAFHHTQPRRTQLYAIPQALSEQGLLRFGFHGLSYAHIADVLTDLLPPEKRRRTIVAHLGSGASLCAMMDGKSIATSMGLTALDGVPMATRSGSIDPGLVLHLIKDRGMLAEDVADLLYKQSGLLGLSGISGDVRELLASNAPAAAEALDVFTYRIAREIGSLAAALQGLATLVFTGGVGENAWQIRQSVCEQLGWLGVDIDPLANEEGGALIQSPHSETAIAAIPADEEAVIARETLGVLGAAS